MQLSLLIAGPQLFERPMHPTELRYLHQTQALHERLLSPVLDGRFVNFRSTRQKMFLIPA